MPEQQRNLLLAIVLSALILGGFQMFYEGPRQKQEKQLATVEHSTAASSQIAGRADTPAADVSAIGEQPVQDRAAAIAAGQPRIRIQNPRLYGSLSRQGIRFDDLTFAGYFTAIDNKTHVDLLSPTGTEAPYFTALGWSAGDSSTAKLPDDTTKWALAAGSPATLTQDTPVTLTWDNGQGLVFTRQVAIDANYMFTVTDTVSNKGKSPISLAHYASITRQGTPPVAKRTGDGSLERLMGVFDGHLADASYGKLKANKLSPDEAVRTSTGGWIAASDKYWLVAAIPDQSDSLTAEFRHSMLGKLDVFQADYATEPKTIAPGATSSETTRLFAGAKEVNLLTGYRDNLNIPKLDLAVDWGFFRFLTKPFFYSIDFLARHIGNFGLGILAFTVCIRILILPLGWKTFRTMNRLGELSPEMTALKTKHGANKETLQKDLLALYQREGVNPVSGCLPMLLQIPIFISLFKVLSTTIEMRQQPFFWYVHDLSAPDPTNLFTLFGLLPEISFLPHLGFLPLVLGCTLMGLQLNSPRPPDPTQAKIMLLNPVIFTFMMGSAPLGLIIYYILSNTISIGQQRLVRKVYRLKYKPVAKPVAEPAA